MMKDESTMHGDKPLHKQNHTDPKKDQTIHSVLPECS